MQYEHAKKCIRKLYAAEILLIISSLTVVFSGLLSLMIDAAERLSSENPEVLGYQFLAGAVYVGGLVLMTGSFAGEIIASVLAISGLNHGRKDEKQFRTAMIFVILNLIISGIGTGFFIFSEKGSTGEYLARIPATAAEILGILFAVNGITSLAEKIGDKRSSERGRELYRILSAILGLSGLLRAAPVLYLDSENFSSADGAYSVAYGIVSLAAYVIYMLYLRHGLKMLTNHNN